MTLFDADIRRVSEAHGLNPALVAAMVLVESGGQTRAYRYEPNFYAKYLAGKPEWQTFPPERCSASYGLMQVMYPVAVEMGFRYGAPEYLYVPYIGLEYGCRKLAQLLDWSHGLIPQALAAYNGGRVANAKPPYRNQFYVDKVLARLTP